MSNLATIQSTITEVLSRKLAAYNDEQLSTTILAYIEAIETTTDPVLLLALQCAVERLSREVVRREQANAE